MGRAVAVRRSRRGLLSEVGDLSKWLIYIGVALTMGVALVCPLAAQSTVQNPHGPLAMPCQNCHTTTSFSPIRAVPEFNHNTQTGYPLRGAHTAVACNSCHVSRVFTAAGTQCADCHADLHRRQFGALCENCHTVQSWKAISRPAQDHFNRFPLLGAHATTACDSCHKGAAVGNYVGLNTNCDSCHLKDYLGAKTVDHKAANFPTQCDQCHGVQGWLSTRFDHARFTGFALVGAHSTLACVQCHVGGRLQGIPTDCFSCHVQDFNKTTNPNHVAAGFSRDCSVCHTSSVTWLNAKFDHNQTKFPLTGKHIGVDCALCHINNNFTALNTACSSCHVKEYQATTNPAHAAAGFSQECQLCHTTSDWLSARFDHNATKFPLTGAHIAQACSACHVNNQFATLSTACSTCHTKDFQSAANPNHVAGGFPQQCELCHTTVQWLGAKFDHSTTKFPLTGKHTSVQCVTCHANGQYATLSTDCVSCHLTQFQQTKTPNHVAAGFSQSCQLCHSTADWLNAQFDHNTTKFPLTGKHSATPCSACHVNNQYATLATACNSCHLKEYQATSNPSHTTAGFPQDCQLCHSTTDWLSAKFDHNTTRFPLTGKHASTACAQCHANGQYSTLPTACNSCHIKEYQATTTPNHVAAGFPQDCQLCHSTTDWLSAKFDHNTTRFPLTGKHTTTACAACHVNNQYATLATDCASCHLKEFQATTNPNHAAAGFSQNCQTCHSTTDWLSAKFDHNATKFPLTGKHATTACAQCHTNGQYATLSTACNSCHLKEYQATTTPNHVAAGFPQDCQLCHSTTDWLSAKFDHNATKFPLTGKHTTTGCASCHVNNQYATLPTACNSCHLKEYQATTAPNHVAANFPQDCQLCHSTTDWLSATFDHSKTKFPLTGKHTTVQCATCHVNNQYVTLPTACNSCHLKEYQATTMPNHAAANFSQDCQVCHSTADWLSASFDHSKTKFPLTGKHTTVQCATCHVNNQYATLPTACNSCHLKEYQATTAPNHVAAGFPQDCSLCHSTTDWLSAKFDHNKTKFPLTGKHTTVLCATCHVNGQYATLPTNCSSCHLKEYQGTNNPVHSAAGFSQDCQTCHTTTDWLSASFNHNLTKFPLTGKHTAVQCLACHTVNPYSSQPTACFSCHAKEFNATTSPNHAAAGFAQTCESCHSTTDWLSATFNHNTTKFPLTGKHTTVQCAACHTVTPYSAQSTACFSCHAKEYNATTAPPHAASAFPQDCSLCHSTTDWTGATFDHSKTKFPLTGAHTSVQCATCHTNNQYATLPLNCDACHIDKYNATTNPNHVAAGFPKDCSLCHSTTDWTSATFDHSKTKFPLTGKHTSVACLTCHTSNQYATLATNCDSCHISSYNSTTNPNHVTLGYPKDCSICHSTTDWTSATFNHNNVGFTLVGKHATTPCLSCHVGGKFPGTPTDCYSCHVTDYTNTTAPAHSSTVNAQFFPHTCTTCHLTTIIDWTGANFNHAAVSQFPTNHGGQQRQCAECHTNQSDLSVFSCTNCHAKATTDSHHSQVHNYVYNSINCLQCHPAGRTN